MTCVLTMTGELHIYNALQPETALNSGHEFTEVELPRVNQTEGTSNWPMIMPNQWFRFPGTVYQIGMLNNDITMLA